MNFRTLIFCILILFASLLLAFEYPDALSKNSFLKGFINHELLNILAVIVTITSASAAHIHLSLNAIEERVGKGGFFKKSRKEVNFSAFYLIGFFVLTIILLIVRSFYLNDKFLVAGFNVACLWVLFLSVLVLIDITRAAFAIGPAIVPKQGENMNLKEARKEGKIKEFIKEHSKDPKGDKEKFDKTLKNLSSQKPKEAPGASDQDSSES